jgi:hypothetical protein
VVTPAGSHGGGDRGEPLCSLLPRCCGRGQGLGGSGIFGRARGGVGTVARPRELVGTRLGGGAHRQLPAALHTRRGAAAPLYSMRAPGCDRWMDGGTSGGARGRTTPVGPWDVARAVRRRGARGVLGVCAVMGKERPGRARPQTACARGHRGSGADAARCGRGRGPNVTVCLGLTAFLSKILNRIAQSGE